MQTSKTIDVNANGLFTAVGYGANSSSYPYFVNIYS